MDQEHAEEEGPERIERLPGELDSAMYTGTDEGEPTPGPAEMGPPANRDEALEVFKAMDEEIAAREESGEEQAG